MRGARRFARDFPRLPGDGRHEPVRRRREPRADAGLGRAADRGLRADPVRAADRAGARGPAAVRPADDQQVLRARPRARPQHGRVARAAGPAGVRDLVAQPGRRAGPLRPRHLRRRGARGARRRRRDHQAAARAPERRLLGRHHRRRRARAPRGGAAADRRRERHAARRGARQRACRAPRRRSPAARSPPRRSPSRPAAATSTAGRSAASSRGCGRTTSSGATSSTTTCWARPRRRSTSCTGTRTRCAWPPACTATSSTCRSRTGSPGRARRPCSARGVDLGEVDLDSYVVAGLTDHIIPWENAYRSTQLLGGAPRFVLSTSGHIQALVNPPAPDESRELPARRRASGGPRGMGAASRDAPGQLVARLRRLARRALGRAQARSEAARRRLVQGAREGARNLRPRRLRGTHVDPDPPVRAPRRRARDRLLPGPRPVHGRAVGALPRDAPVRRPRGAAGDQPLLGGGRAAVAADAPARRARPLRRGHRRPRLPRHERAGARPREHGAAPRRRQPRDVPRRPVGAGDEVDRPARLRGSRSSAGCPRWRGSTRSARSR